MYDLVSIIKQVHLKYQI